MKPGETRTLHIGGHTKRELLAALAREGVQLNAYAQTLFADPGFTTRTERTRIQVTRRSLPELGLHGGGTFGAILEAAAERGLRPCPLEVGPHLRLVTLDQPEGPYLTVASELLRLDEATPNGFYLRHRPDGMWLRGYRAGPENVYEPTFSDFVFEIPPSHTGP